MGYNCRLNSASGPSASAGILGVVLRRSGAKMENAPEYDFNVHNQDVPGKNFTVVLLPCAGVRLLLLQCSVCERKGLRPGLATEYRLWQFIYKLHIYPCICARITLSAQ